MPACSTLRNRGLGDWRDARTSAWRPHGQRKSQDLLNAEFFNTKDCHLPLVPSNRTTKANDVRIRDVPQYRSSRNKVVKASASARPSIDIANIVRKTVDSLLGTEVADDAPLMGAGLDSIAAVDLV